MNFSVLISDKTAISFLGGFVTLFLHPEKNGQDIMASEEIRAILLTRAKDLVGSLVPKFWFLNQI